MYFQQEFLQIYRHAQRMYMTYTVSAVPTSHSHALKITLCTTVRWRSAGNYISFITLLTRLSSLHIQATAPTRPPPLINMHTPSPDVLELTDGVYTHPPPPPLSTGTHPPWTCWSYWTSSARRCHGPYLCRQAVSVLPSSECLPRALPLPQ